MRSLIILEVEHGEDTDVLNAMIIGAQRNAAVMENDGHEIVLNDYTVRVDLPACFVLDSGDVAPEWCEDCDTDHDPGKCPLGD